MHMYGKSVIIILFNYSFGSSFCPKMSSWSSSFLCQFSHDLWKSDAIWSFLLVSCSGM